MSTKIIYQVGHQPVAIITPTETDITKIHQEAKRLVPQGIPYWIVPALNQPTEQVFRNAWRADEAALGEISGRGGVCD